MALVIADRVLETCSSPGTGTVSLLGATSGYQSFASAIGNGNTCYYTIADQSGSNWEVGIGTVTAGSPNTLSRDTVLASSNSGITVAFSTGTQNVFVTYPAEKAVYLDASGNVKPSLGALTASSITDSGLTSGRVTYASTGGLLADSANLTFDGNNLVLSTSSSSDAFRITQTGAGNAFVVEDSTNPDSTPFVIDGNGVVITGTTQSYTIGGVTTTRLQIHGTTQGPASQGIVNWGATITAPLLTTAKSRSGTIGTHTIVQDDDSLGAWIAQGSNGTSFLTATSIYAQVDGTPATNSMPGRLVFSTTANGASSPTERMRIDSSGNIGIGTSSPVGLLTANASTASTIGITTYTGNETAERTTISAFAGIGISSYQGVSGSPYTKVSDIVANADGTVPSIMRFWTKTNGQASASERMRIDSSGNVGIGTSSPAVKLDVNGEIIALSGASTQDRHIEIGYGRTGNGNSYVDLIGDTTYSDFGTRLIRYNTGANAATDLIHRGTGGLNLTSNDAGFISLNTNGSERMRIDSNGLVGIGLTPSGSTIKLQVSTDASIHGLTVGLGAGSVSGNTAVGSSALAANTTGANNTAIGYQAGKSNTTANNNTFIGAYVGYANTTGIANAAVGGNSTGTPTFYTNTTGSYNTAIGISALATNNANNNSALGYQALYSNTTGSPNDAFGYQALYNNTTGNYNVAVGYQSLLTNTVGINNTAVGNGALQLNSSGSHNTAFGQAALQNNTANNNTAVGRLALNNNTSGSPNDAFGYQALYSNTTGVANVGIGYQSLYTNSTANYNVALGYSALYNNNSDGNTAIGYNSLKSNTGSGLNTAVGYNALNSNTAAYNTAVGASALTANTTGTNNVAVGYQTLTANTIGTDNTAVGNTALLGNTTGIQNTAIGSNAGAGITTGSYNVCMGVSAGNYTTVLTTGNENIVIGRLARTSSAGAANQIVLGANVGGFGDSRLTFGSSAGKIYSSAFTTATVTWTQSSDQRLKQDIKDNHLGLDFINELRPVTFRWKPTNEIPQELYNYYKEENDRDTETIQHGFIAQEVKAALDKYDGNTLPAWDIEDDGTQGVGVGAFVVPLINAVKELSAQNAALIARIEALENK